MQSRIKKVASSIGRTGVPAEQARMGWGPFGHQPSST